MSLNGSMGLGVLLEAKDMASGVIASFGKNLQTTAGKASEAAEAIGNHMRSFGLGLSVMGAGIAGLALLAGPTKAFGEFANGIAEITTLSNEASFSTLNLSEMVLKMNAAYGGGTASQTKALYDGISAGAANAAEANALLDASNKLGVAGRAEVGVALDGLTSSANAYGDSFSNAAKYSDALFVAVQKGKTTIPELAGVIGRVSPTASAMGISFDEVTAALAAVTLKGLKTEEAATGLKAAMTNIIQPTSSAAAEAAKLGIKFDQTTLKSLGFKGFLDSITGSSKFSATSLSALFTSTEALNTVLALTADGSSKFNDALAAMGNKTGATDKAFEKMAATTEFQGKKFNGLAENAKILIGEVLDPMRAAALALANSFIKAFNDMPDGLRNFLVRGFALVSTLLVVVGGAMAMKAAIGLASAGLSAMGVTAASVASAFFPVLGSLALVALAFYALREAYDQNIGGMADAVDVAVDKIHLAFSALGQLFSDGGFSGGVLDDLNKADNMGLKNFVIRIYVTVARIRAAFSGIADGFFGVINTMKPSFDALMSALSGVGAAFSGLFEMNDATEAKSTFDSFASAGKTIGAALGTVAKAIVNIATVALDILGGFISKLAPVGDLISTVFSVVGDVFSDISQQMADMNGTVDGSASGWRAFGETIGNIVAVAASVIKSLVLTIGGALRSAMNILGGIADLFTGNFERGIKRILYGIVSLIAGAVLGAIDLLARASDAFLGTDFSKTVQSWRTGMDATLQEGFGLKKHEYAAGSEEDVLNRQQLTAEAQRGMAPDPLDFYAPDAMPAVAGAEAASYAQVDAASIGQAVADGVKSMPGATNTVIVQIGDEKVAEIVGKAKASDDFRSGGPWVANL